jgi:hypothetical protein
MPPWCVDILFSPSFVGELNLISIELIVLVAYLGSWAFVEHIIFAEFLSNHCPFLLEAIGVNSFGLFSFWARLKLAWEFLPLDVVTYISLFK